MKAHYKGILLLLFAVLSFGFLAPQPAGAEVTATALPLGDFLEGGGYYVNNSGQSAGYVKDSDGYDHACLWEVGALAPTILDRADGELIDFVFTYPDDINLYGRVAGTVYNVEWDEARGFFWTEAEGMVDIGVPFASGDYTHAWVNVYGLNDNGQVIADAEAYDVVDEVWDWVGTKNVIWSNGAFTELTYIGPDSTYPFEVRFGAINNSGQVAGRAIMGPGEGGHPAALWDGTATILTPGINVGQVYINNSGQVAGGNEASGQNPWIYTPGQALQYIDVIGEYPDMSDGTIYVTGLNDEGQVLIYQSSPVIRALVWQEDESGGDTFIEIPLSSVMGPESHYPYTYNLNEWGQTLVQVYGPMRSFFWDAATPGGMTELVPLPDMTGAGINRMNDDGLIAGYSYTYTYAPCTWQTAGAVVNYPPVLDVSAAPSAGFVGTEIIFRATATDPDAGDTLAFSLDSDAPAGAAIDSTGDFSWTPATAGPYTFTVRVADSKKFYDTEKVTIDVIDNNNAPILTLPATTFNGVVGGTLTFTATATDPDGDSLTFQLSGAPTDASINSTSGVFSWTPTAADTYQFYVEVVDAKGAKDSEQVTVYVAESPLVVSIGQITREGKWVKVLLAVENTGTDRAKKVTLSDATLGDVPTSTRLPIGLGAFKPGGTKNCELKFEDTALSSGPAMLSVSGDSSLGGFAATLEVLVP